MLGSMLLEKDAIGEVISVLRDAGSAAFARESHQTLFDVLVQLYLANQPIDGVLIKEALVQRGLWDSLGGYEFLGRFVSAVPSALRARHYAEIVYDKYLLRQLIEATHQVTEAALDTAQPAGEVLEFAERTIFAVTERRVATEAQLLPELVHEAFRSIEARGREALTGVRTGFDELDELTCGLQRGELVIVAGRPSMGKTAFGLNIAQNMAVTDGQEVVFFSLEMSRQQLTQRLLCSDARVDSHALRRGRHSREDLARLHEAGERLSHAPLLIDDTADLTIMELRARARMAARRLKNLAAVFVDYLQLMRVPRSENRQVEVSTISRGLKAMAKDLGVPVVAMAQLNRATEDKSRRGNRPRMSDLRESGAIEQDADVIMLLHRESYYRGEAPAGAPDASGEENVAEVILAKQRNGPTGDIKLYFDRRFTRFANYAPATARYDYPPPRGADAAPF